MENPCATKLTEKLTLNQQGNQQKLRNINALTSRDQLGRNKKSRGFDDRPYIYGPYMYVWMYVCCGRNENAG